MIVVFGTVCIDCLRRVAALPAPGEYTEVLEELIVLGGEAANTALALQVWGREVRLFTNPLGSGSEAEHLRRLIVEKGLPDGYLKDGKAPTPVCDIYVTPDGDRTMFGRGFADMEAVAVLDDLPTVAGEWFTAEPNMGAPAREAVRRATAAGMKTYLMDYFGENEPIEPGSFWQSCTEWIGTRADRQATLEWTKAWVDHFGCFAVVTDGLRGFVAGSPTHPVRHYGVFPCDEVIDSTGAGDAFRAGMLYGLDQGWAAADCLRFASAAGCLECQVLGATTRIPDVEEIERLIAANPDVADSYD